MMKFVAMVAVAVWAFCVFMGVEAYLSTVAEGSGFTRGTNRISAFLKWELIALAPAFVAFLGARRASGGLKLLFRTPLFLSGGFFTLLITLFVGAIVYTRFIA